MIGVNCLFNEVIPTYTEEYIAELNKMKFETVEDASSVSNFEYLIGVRYVDYIGDYISCDIAVFKNCL